MTRPYWLPEPDPAPVPPDPPKERVPPYQWRPFFDYQFVEGPAAGQVPDPPPAASVYTGDASAAPDYAGLGAAASAAGSAIGAEHERRVIAAVVGDPPAEVLHMAPIFAAFMDAVKETWQETFAWFDSLTPEQRQAIVDAGEGERVTHHRRAGKRRLKKGDPDFCFGTVTGFAGLTADTPVIREAPP